MKASDRGRNVKSKELFGCFDEFFISMFNPTKWNSSLLWVSLAFLLHWVACLQQQQQQQQPLTVKTSRISETAQCGSVTTTDKQQEVMKACGLSNRAISDDLEWLQGQSSIGHGQSICDRWASCVVVLLMLMDAQQDKTWQRTTVLCLWWYHGGLYPFTMQSWKRMLLLYLIWCTICTFSPFKH